MTRAAHPLRVALVAAEAEVRRLAAERDTALLELVFEGATYRAAGEVFGLSAQRVAQIVARHRAEVRPETPAQRLRSAREAWQLAKHAQDLRAERETGGNATELRAFYGDDNESPADVVETPIKWRLTDWYESDSAALRRAQG